MSRYKGFEMIVEESICIYCGMPRECRDHVTPYSWKDSGAYTKGLLAPSCRECNQLLSDSFPFTLSERIALAKARLRGKHSKTINFPHWTNDELSELGPDLRDSILQSLRRQKLLQERLAFDYPTWIRLARPKGMLPVASFTEYWEELVR